MQVNKERSREQQVSEERHVVTIVKTRNKMQLRSCDEGVRKLMKEGVRRVVSWETNGSIC